MEDITLILLVATIAIYVATIVLPKRKELYWLSLILSVCSIGGILIDETVVGDQFALMLVPCVFVFFMSILKVAGFTDKW